jgi:hypothetical protein
MCASQKAETSSVHYICPRNPRISHRAVDGSRHTALSQPAFGCAPTGPLRPSIGAHMRRPSHHLSPSMQPRVRPPGSCRQVVDAPTVSLVGVRGREQVSMLNPWRPGTPRGMHTMWEEISRNRLVGFWFTTIAVISTSIFAMGVNGAVDTTAFLLTVSVVTKAAHDHASARFAALRSIRP